MAKSTYLSNLILNHVFNAAAFSSPATVYFGLLVSGVEVTGSNYSRAAVTANTTNFPTATSGSITTGTNITFPTPSGSWGTVNGFGIYDASTSGNTLYTGSVSPPITIGAGTPVRFPAGLVVGTES